MAAGRKVKKVKQVFSTPKRLEIKVGALQRACGPRLLQIHLWAVDNSINLGLAMVAQEVVAVAGPLLEFVCELRSPAVKAKFPEQPKRGVWLSYYRGDQELWRKIAEKVFGAKRGADFVNAYTDACMLISNREKIRDAIAREKIKIMRRDVLRGVKRVLREYRRRLDILRWEFTEAVWQMRPDFEKQLAKTPELQFALKVILPCLIRFRTSPRQLMRRAQLGNDIAIENLIRLDGNVVYESKIAAWIGSGKGSVREWRQQSVGHWLNEGIAGELDVVRFKKMIGGLVSFYGQGLAVRINSTLTKAEKYKLTAPVIKMLFDAVARDRGVATSAGKDPDIADCSLQAWAKAIERYRKIWEIGVGVRTDKKSIN